MGDVIRLDGVTKTYQAGATIRIVDGQLAGARAPVLDEGVLA